MEDLSFRATNVYNHLVSGTFHYPFGLLFSFHSRYYCAIGLRTYLDLELVVPHVHEGFPTPAIRDTLTF